MKDTTRSAIIAGLAILAVSLAASTLNSTVIPDSNGQSGPEGYGGDGDGGLLPPPQSGPTPGETLQIPLLTEILTFLAVIALLAFIAYVIIYWREALGIILASIALLGLVFILFRFLGSPVPPPNPPMMEPGNGSIFGGGSGSGEADTTQPSPPSLIVLLILGLALIGAVVALFRTTTGDSDDSPGETGDGGTNAAAVGRAAGRAVDRLEKEADVDNEVYRTWREMTELLDVDDPETSTPGEFAAAAVEAGLGRDDVGELTRLFEDVRYGNQQPSDEHEQRAITVFRRIEDQYAEDDL